MNKVIKYAVINAVLTALYIVAIASFLSQAERIFGQDEPETILIPIIMLLLFVASAAITGSLVLGRPVLWYLDGQKKEAVSLLAYTIGSLFIITFLAMVSLAVMR